MAVFIATSVVEEEVDNVGLEEPSLDGSLPSKATVQGLKDVVRMT